MLKILLKILLLDISQNGSILTAVDRCIQSSMGDARDAMLNAAIDMLSAYGGTLPVAQRMGQLASAYQTRLMPVFILAMLKYVSQKQ